MGISFTKAVTCCLLKKAPGRFQAKVDKSENHSFDNISRNTTYTIEIKHKLKSITRAFLVLNH